MSHTATNSVTLGDYADVIAALHRTDRRRQAGETWKAILVGVLLAVLGGAVLIG